VADLTATLPAAVRRDFIEPLCVAALNTPAVDASGTVFLRVLRDALGSSAGAADLLLPRRGLGEIFPAPALAWLEASGATLRLAHRVERLERRGDGWSIDAAGVDRVDRVIVAASAVEAARLIAPHDAAWAEQTMRLRYEPIVTVYARSAGCLLPEPLLALEYDDARPAQFVFDHGRLGGDGGLLGFVISGAAAWVERGAAVTEQATIAQATVALRQHLRGPLEPVRTVIEKRATFACTPGLRRPTMAPAAGLFACGDYIDGPYPATLEGAVRSGVAAAAAALR
jgi:predicted NAD/FAD-binding protein